jgi:hypothetical protein
VTQLPEPMGLSGMERRGRTTGLLMRVTLRRHAGVLIATACAMAAMPGLGAEEYSFDVEQFESRAFELRGYAEIEPSYSDSNQDGALYQLEFIDEEQRDEIFRLPAVLELDGRYRRDIMTLGFRTHTTKTWDYTDQSGETLLYEGLLNLQPDPGFSFDLGKKAYRWGTGYAWNPVAFVERAKDAGNPDLAREGYWIAGFDYIKTYGGSLKTAALTPLVLPNRGNINNDFGQEGFTNYAAKLYLLYRNTDIDFMFLSDGSKTARYGMDFASNITTNFAIHGELAYITDVSLHTITPDCTFKREAPDDKISSLLGLRYRTEQDVTWIAEYYYNGAGNRLEDQQQFYECVHRAWDAGDPELLSGLPLDEDLDKGPFTKPNPMRQYFHLRAFWREPYNILYFTPGFQWLYNLQDNSYSIAPELNYEGVNNVDLRLRLTVPVGDVLTEWGEKPNKYKAELRVRYYF